jgi:hypothetical protein
MNAGTSGWGSFFVFFDVFSALAARGQFHSSFDLFSIAVFMSEV